MLEVAARVDLETCLLSTFVDGPEGSQPWLLTIEDENDAEVTAGRRNTTAPLGRLAGGDTSPFAVRESGSSTTAVKGCVTSIESGIRGGNVPAGNGHSTPVSLYRAEATS